jgi:hypothetical protein
MDYGFRDDRWYGAFYGESADDTLEVVMGRILRDLRTDRAKELLPRNSIYTVALVGMVITVNVYVTPGLAESDTDKAKIRDRVNVIGDRYNWVGKTNPSDVRYQLKCSVQAVRMSVTSTVVGNLFG